MRIALVDDDPSSKDLLLKYITERIGHSHTIEWFESGEQFLTSRKSDSFDLIILDIFMNGLTGLDVAKRIRQTDENVRLVFCTSSNEFAGESYEVNASYYLCKPITAEQIDAMIARLKLKEAEFMRTAALPDGQSVILRNIIYIDIMSRHTIFHNKKGAHTDSKLAFSAVEALICTYPYFFSPSKGIIVNFHEVAAIKDNVFIMSDGTHIPISRRKFKETNDAYASFCFDKLRKGGDL